MAEDQQEKYNIFKNQSSREYSTTNMKNKMAEHPVWPKK